MMITVTLLRLRYWRNKTMSKNVSFGIDLGTTNSCISMLRSNASIPSIIPLKYGNTIQSCAMLNEDGTLTVGKEAYEHRYEESAIYSVKRFMGSNKRITLKSGDKEVTMSPEEVSAEILKAIVQQASEYVGEGIIKDVTITVPAHFNDAQRRATKAAGELAGLNVISIINEPTSAGLLYGLDNAKTNQTILVYDLGGGTFDVSILRVTKELRAFPMLGINTNGEYNKTAINIIGNDGDVALGGDDIDANVTKYVIEDIARQAGIAKEKVIEIIGKKGFEELKLRLEKAKKSGQGIIIYNLDGYGEYTVQLLSKDVEEKCYRPVFERSFELVAKAMSNAGVTVIDHIVLVGGSTKSQIIQNMLKEKFPHLSTLNTFEPDLSVALGASISSATALGVSKIATITDVVPMSIGILAGSSDGTIEYNKMLKKDTQLPCTYDKAFNIVDQTKDIILDVRQGESLNNIDKLTPIGKLVIKSNQYQGNKLIVSFKCDLNGVLSCFVIIDNHEIPIDIQYSANIVSAKNTDVAGYDDMDKGQKFFYDSHLRKLKSAGISEDKLKEWTPALVMRDLTEAKQKFNELLQK